MSLPAIAADLVEKRAAYDAAADALEDAARAVRHTYTEWMLALVAHEDALERERAGCVACGRTYGDACPRPGKTVADGCYLRGGPLQQPEMSDGASFGH